MSGLEVEAYISDFATLHFATFNFQFEIFLLRGILKVKWRNNQKVLFVIQCLKIC